MKTLCVLILMTLKTSAEERTCVQCATPTLRDKWSATGLPKRPDALKFDKECVDPGATQTSQAEWMSKVCGSSCFELMVPVEGYFQYVRGCHEDFVWDEFKVSISNNTKVCQLNQIQGNTSFLTSGGTYSFTGTSFCQPPVAAADGTVTFCNVVLTDKTVTDTGATSCTAGTTHSCKSCAENDGSGSCTASSASTCQGVYCTKTTGKINGHFYESRGCASFNPFASSICSWADETLNISTGVNSDVGLTFRANQCFCQGELCNSSRSSTLFFSVFSLTFLFFS